MAKKCENWLTDEEVEQEKAIIEYRRSQHLYTIRDLEEKVKAIMEELVSLEKSLMLCIQAKRVK